MDSHKNFAYSAIAVAPSPASSGLSLTITTGQGAQFPATPFNATVWPTAALALSTNAEIVRVTAIVGDVLTILRAQEGSTARTIIVGDQIAATITVKSFTDIETALATITTATQAANRVYAGPATGSPGTPDFRALVAADIPSLSAVYDVAGTAAAAILTHVGLSDPHTQYLTEVAAALVYQPLTLNVGVDGSILFRKAADDTIDGSANLMWDGASVAVRGSANVLGLAGSATGAPVTITASGSDANVGIELVPKGLGQLFSGVHFGARLPYTIAHADDDLYPIGLQVLLTSTSTGRTNPYGLEVQWYHNGTGEATSGYGISFYGERNSTGGTAVNLYGINSEMGVGAAAGLTDNLYGIRSSAFSLGGAVTNGYGMFATIGGTVVTNGYAFYAPDLAGAATQAYYFWANSQGVYRIREDAVADTASFPQAIPALYNPRFTKYTAGAANYERSVEQWVNNVLQIGAQAGGTGTLQTLQLLGASVTTTGNITAANLSGTNTGDQVINEAALTFTDITTANATSLKHGLLPKLSGSSSDVLKGDGTWGAGGGGGGGGDALVANPLSQFAATTSLQLLGVMSDETGSGALVFGTAPTLTGPVTLTEAVGSSGLTITGATQTASFPALTVTQTWNNAGVTFTARRTNITDTASAAGSLVEDWQVGGVSKAALGKAGVLTVGNAGADVAAISVRQTSTTGTEVVRLTTYGYVDLVTDIRGGTTIGGAQNFWIQSTGAFFTKSTGFFAWSNGAASGTTDLWLTREAAATLQMGVDVNGAAVAQTIKACDGITGTDKTGGDFTLGSGRGTGAGAVSSLFFQTPTVLTTGTTAQSLATRLTLTSSAMTSTVLAILPATTTAAASLRLPHGTAPTSPVDGDMWTTTAGVFVRINGVTVGPLA